MVKHVYDFCGRSAFVCLAETFITKLFHLLASPVSHVCIFVYSFEKYYDCTLVKILFSCLFFIYTYIQLPEFQGKKQTGKVFCFRFR